MGKKKDQEVVEIPKDEDEQAVEKAQGCCSKPQPAEPEPPTIPMSRILGLISSCQSNSLMFFGGLLSVINGATLPAFSIIFGTLFNVFFDITKPDDERSREIANVSFLFLGLAAIAFLCSYGSNTIWVIMGERVVKRLRLLFFESLLKQEVAYFDSHQSGQLVSRLSADVLLVQSGVSDKLGQAFYYTAQILGGIIVAFVKGWKMTLVLLACSPAIIAVGALQTMFLTAKAKKGQSKYAQANDVSGEAISGIRTIYSFVAESHSSTRYDNLLEQSYMEGVKKAHVTGVGIGFSFFFMFAIYALGFWYGGTLVVSREMLAGDVLTVFFSIVIGAMGIGQASQLTPDIAKAKGAAAGLFEVIDRVPQIKVNEGTGDRKDKLKGKIQFKDATFAYPARADLPVFKNFNLTVPAGKTVALVGPSGGGKSTTVQLLERFYDVSSGKITIDGVDIKDYDLKWLRTQIGLVSQEPILFSGTIEDNIRYGKWDATDEEVIAAAKAANAHKFISEQKKGYKTQVGEKGLQLSGGQKQRVAIARAVLKNPRILLLDEATSALDAESEHLVQEALDKLMKGRTTIVIAHRLTTVKDADKICVIQKGQMVEEGTHHELIEKGGVYCALVNRQMKAGLDEPLETAPKKKSGSDDLKEKVDDTKEEKNDEKIVLTKKDSKTKAQSKKQTAPTKTQKRGSKKSAKNDSDSDEEEQESSEEQPKKK